MIISLNLWASIQSLILLKSLNVVRSDVQLQIIRLANALSMLCCNECLASLEIRVGQIPEISALFSNFEHKSGKIWTYFKYPSFLSAYMIFFWPVKRIFCIFMILFVFYWKYPYLALSYEKYFLVNIRMWTFCYLSSKCKDLRLTLFSLTQQEFLTYTTSVGCKVGREFWDVFTSDKLGQNIWRVWYITLRISKLFDPELRSNRGIKNFLEGKRY